MLRATLKSLLARKLRLVLSGLAVVLGVMFVSGAFVLTDTLGRSFDAVFADAYSETDVAVTAKPKVEVGEFEGEQVPATVPASDDHPDQGRARRRRRHRRGRADGARLIGSNGKVVASFGPPQLRRELDRRERPARSCARGAGRPPTTRSPSTPPWPRTATSSSATRSGCSRCEPKKTFTLVGIFGYSGDRDTLGGVNEVAFTTPVAQQLMLGEKDVFTSIDVKAAGGVDDATAARPGRADAGRPATWCRPATRSPRTTRPACRRASSSSTTSCSASPGWRCSSASS